MLGARPCCPSMESLADFLGVHDLKGPDDKPVAEAPSPKLTAKEFCRRILASEEYRQSLLNRILLGELPPALEQMMWDRAHGKVVEKVEVRNPSNALESLTVDQLEARALYLASIARTMRSQQADNKESEAQGSVH